MSDFLQRLEGVKGRNGDYMARCPCHDDSTQSLSVRVGEENRILLKCFAGCSVENIVGAMGLSMTDLFADDTRHNTYPTYKASSSNQKPTLEAEYLYAGGTLKKQKFRRSDGSKYCTWKHLKGGKWENGRNNILPGLYQSQPDLPEIFFLVEGEKDVDSLKRAGMVAVSLPDGAQSKWEPAYDDAFRDKQVIILPDNDEPGKKYARMCAEKIHAVAAGVKLLDLVKVWPEMPPKADVSDLIMQFDQSTAMDMVIKLANETAPWEPAKAAETDPLLSLFKPLTDFTEEDATWLIPGWVPDGQITLVAADGGVGKTTLWVHIVAALSAGNRCILDPPGHSREPLRVAFCTTEDSVRKKLVRKLRQAGANMGNILAMDMAADAAGSLKNFKFGSPDLKRVISYFKPALCIFDPVQGFVPPEINMGSRNAMRDCLAPLISLGEDVGCTFLIIAHSNKRKGAFGRDRIADSADLWDISRSVIMAGYTGEHGTRYLSNEKNNYARLQDTVLFTIDDSGTIIKEGETWKKDRDFIQESAVAKTAPKREDCRECMIDTLEAAPEHSMKTDDLIKALQMAGHSPTAIRRVREQLKSEGIVETYATGSARQKTRAWYVRLKPPAPEPAFQELPYETPVPFDSPSA